MRKREAIEGNSTGYDDPNERNGEDDESARRYDGAHQLRVFIIPE